MRAHLVQLDIAWEDKEVNFARVRSLLDSAEIAPGDLIVLPEMFDTGFSFNTDVTADGTCYPISSHSAPTVPSHTPATAQIPDATLALGSPGPTYRFLAELARQRRAFVHGARTIIDADNKGRNLASVFGPDGNAISEYAKIHPFSYGKESLRFVGGTNVITYSWTPPNAESVTVCPAVCYDLRFPEIFREGLRLGASLFVIGANWPAPRATHWRTLLIARAIENQAFVIGVNRTGSDPALTYSGGSIAIGPKGDILGELADAEAVLSVVIDPAFVREWRQTFPAWRDMKLLQPLSPGAVTTATTPGN